MSREAHVQFCERLGVKFLGATLPLPLCLNELSGTSSVLEGEKLRLKIAA